MSRISADATKSTREAIQSIGKEYGLQTAEAYGAALRFAETEQEAFEEFLTERSDDADDSDSMGLNLEGGPLEDEF